MTTNETLLVLERLIDDIGYALEDAGIPDGTEGLIHASWGWVDTLLDIKNSIQKEGQHD